MDDKFPRELDKRVNAIVRHYANAYYRYPSPIDPRAFMKELEELVRIARHPKWQE